MADPSESHDADTSNLDRDPQADLDETKDEFEASLEAELKPSQDASDTAMNLDGDGADNAPDTDMPTIEARLPAKKDASLREFLSKMDDYAPIIPDAVINYYLTLAGLPPPPATPPHLARLLALATQKFIADIAADAYQYSRIRSTNTTSNNPLTGLGGAAGFGMMGGAAGADETKKGKETGKNAPLGGPRAGYGGAGVGGGTGRTVLTMEDLGMAVGEYGVNVKRGDFYR
ncbi:transcription initiation factor TFIID 23-30kDa subunit-domain-containing protein [Elsinoe ampelina]|uniref:Transcription initiation factor TFIID subunit 10 n=1 Tax=Elsinoe ampelina TaxID=302913 RepID=A0A6A6GN20_9PEZI|nr:transcription initiation factor TFIID 23-30kDa subunit-domain-containing protein [Elsinoe ampelina]